MGTYNQHLDKGITNQHCRMPTNAKTQNVETYILLRPTSLEARVLVSIQTKISFIRSTMSYKEKRFITTSLKVQLGSLAPRVAKLKNWFWLDTKRWLPAKESENNSVTTESYRYEFLTKNFWNSCVYTVAAYSNPKSLVTRGCNTKSLQAEISHGFPQQLKYEQYKGRKLLVISSSS